MNKEAKRRMKREVASQHQMYTWHKNIAKTKVALSFLSILSFNNFVLYSWQADVSHAAAGFKVENLSRRRNNIFAAFPVLCFNVANLILKIVWGKKDAFHSCLIDFEKWEAGSSCQNLLPCCQTRLPYIQ